MVFRFGSWFDFILSKKGLCCCLSVPFFQMAQAENKDSCFVSDSTRLILQAKEGCFSHFKLDFINKIQPSELLQI